MKNDLIPMINNYKKDGLEFVEVTNNVGLTVTFCNLGGSIYSIKYNGELMTYQAKEIKDFLREDVYNGKALGRVAGRIPDGQLVVDKKVYKLCPNEGKTVLHGGQGAISSKKFSLRVFNTTDHVHVVYTYFSLAGEAGFPGNGLFEVHYTIMNDVPSCKVKLLSYVNEKTPVSMTLHTFFSLGEENLKNLSLKINASNYLDISKETLVVGDAKKVPECLDFRKSKPILKDIDDPFVNGGKLKGYDHSFILDNVDKETPQVVLESKKYKLNVYTDFDSVIVYSDNFDAKFAADNSKEKTRRGVAIEPQLSQNKEHYLCRSEEFCHYIRYEFVKK